MSLENKKIPDYQLVDGFRLASAFYPQAFRDATKFKTRPGDLILATYPKCGTTWTQQILYCLLNKGQAPKSFMDFLQFCPFLEMMGCDGLESRPDPRVVKIHLPFNLTSFDPTAKYLYVLRNPKDTLVSFFHHTRTNLYNFVDGDFNVYFELFLNGETDFGDFFDHVLSWYSHQNDPNVLFLYFEEMKKDHRGAIVKIAKFIGGEALQLIQDQTKLDQVVEYSSFAFMKKHTNEDMDILNSMFSPTSNIDDLPTTAAMKHMCKHMQSQKQTQEGDFKLIRKGIVGDWRSNFSEDQNQRMNAKIQEKLKGTEMLEYWNSIGCL